MEVIRTGRKAFHHTVQEPRETDAHRTTDTTQCDALAQQLCDPPALRGRNAAVHGGRRKLAAARFPLVMLFPMTGMSIFLVSVRSTGWARVSDDHSCW